MDLYQKYFVSQHFGKSLATVELDENGGSVIITLAQPDEHNVKFQFENSHVGRFLREDDERAETVMRIAIQQAHKVFLSKGLSGLSEETHPLAAETSPWIGDLTEVPYGGATSGYECALARAFTGAAGRTQSARPA